MAITLGGNQYGKSEVRLVRVTRDGGEHAIRDLNVSIALSGDLAETHLSGDNANVLPTDTQKNTVYAFARKHGVGEIEDFGLLLARHFVSSQPAIHRARVTVEEYGWQPVGGTGHSFARTGPEVRTATVTRDQNGGEAVVSGISGLVLLNSTGSEFWGFASDEYTTLKEARDRVLATEVTARWRHTSFDDADFDDPDWAGSHAATRQTLIGTFAGTHSYSLQQTLYAMGRRVLETRPELSEIRLSMPNKHHFLVDLSPFGMDNDGEVFYAADRPYGLIEGTVRRDGSPDPGIAW